MSMIQVSIPYQFKFISGYLEIKVKEKKKVGKESNRRQIEHGKESTTPA